METVNSISGDIQGLRREIGEKSIHAFAKSYFLHYLTCKPSFFHEELYELLFDTTQKRNKRIAIAAPRGSAKSSVVSLIYIIWSICYQKEKYISLISGTSAQAENFLRDIKSELETNKMLIEDFPEICEIGQKPKPPRWKKDEIITRNNIKVISLGASQKIRGRKHGQHRPTLIILDDVENDENIQSPDQREKLWDWFNKAVLKAGTSQTNVIVIGTIQHYDSLLAKLTDEKQIPGWYKKIYKSIIRESSRPTKWERWKDIYHRRVPYKGKVGSEIAYEYFLDNKEDMLKGTKVLWPEREDYYKLNVMRERSDSSSFDSEKQNEPHVSDRSHFNPKDFHYWDDGEFNSEDELLRILGSDLEMYGACDPSTGRQSRTGDFSAIITLARHIKTGNLYVLDADIENKPLDRLIEDIIVYRRKRSYTKFVFEINQCQKYVLDELKKRLEAEGLYTEIQEITHSTNKETRIRSLLPFVKSGTIRFSKRHGTLIKQLEHFPKGAHDDGPDALEMGFKACYKEHGDECVWFAI